MIAHIARECLNAFESLYRSITQSESETQRRLFAESLSHRLSDARDRFRLWDHGSGATNGTLDRRVEITSLVRQFIADSLDRLNKVLQEGLAVRRPQGKQMEAVVLELHGIVNSLFDITPALGNSAPVNVGDASLGNANLYPGADIHRAKTIFPKARQSLLERIGIANVNRRYRLQTLQREIEVQSQPYEESAEEHTLYWGYI